jgi:hypothetical protein
VPASGSRPPTPPSSSSSFLGDWLDGRDTELLADSLIRFVGHHAYDLPALQADLARFAFLLGDDGERAVGPQHP